MFEADEREVEFGDGIADDVEGAIVVLLDVDTAAIEARLKAGSGEGAGEPGSFFGQFDLNKEDAGVSSEVRDGAGPDKGAGIDHDERIADALDLSKEVGRHED